MVGKVQGLTQCARFCLNGGKPFNGNRGITQGVWSSWKHCKLKVVKHRKKHFSFWTISQNNCVLRMCVYIIWACSGNTNKNQTDTHKVSHRNCGHDPSNRKLKGFYCPQYKNTQSFLWACLLRWSSKMVLFFCVCCEVVRGYCIWWPSSLPH